MKKILKILRAKHVPDYKIHIVFSDGNETTVDFEPFLRASKNHEVSKYLKLPLFKKFKLEKGELMWGDFDLIFPIEDLYNNSILKFNKKNGSVVA